MSEESKLSRRQFISIAATSAAGVALTGLAAGQKSQAAEKTADEEKSAAFSTGTQGKIDHIGMWTWGGRVYNWKKYLNNMKRTGMDTVVLWHNQVPANGRAIQQYADKIGISILWGFNWSWASPVCLNSPDDAELWKAKVLDILKYEYEPIGAKRIVFQTGGTEAGGSCRLNCPVCKKAAVEGVGPIYVKFVNTIMSAVKATYPDLEVCANLHLGGVHKSFEALKVFDPSVQIMWEDIPGPNQHSEAPFAYEWASPKTRLKPTTVEMVKRMCELRGKDEDVSFVIKGFPCWCIAYDPMLLDDGDLKVLNAEIEPRWNEATKYCEEHLDEALEIFRVIANSPARRKSVVLLVEKGLWEYKRHYAALLIAEALKDPFREPKQVIEIAKKTYAEELDMLAKAKPQMG